MKRFTAAKLAFMLAGLMGFVVANASVATGYIRAGERLGTAPDGYPIVYFKQVSGASNADVLVAANHLTGMMIVMDDMDDAKTMKDNLASVPIGNSGAYIKPEVARVYIANTAIPIKENYLPVVFISQKDVNLLVSTNALNNNEALRKYLRGNHSNYNYKGTDYNSDVKAAIYQK